MSDRKAIRVKEDLPREVVKDFAGVRGRVLNAVEDLPRPISFEEASKQVALFHRTPVVQKS
jgi:hypothetical protein